MNPELKIDFPIVKEKFLEYNNLHKFYEYAVSALIKLDKHLIKNNAYIISAHADYLIDNYGNYYSWRDFMKHKPDLEKILHNYENELVLSDELIKVIKKTLPDIRNIRVFLRHLKNLNSFEKTKQNNLICYLTEKINILEQSIEKKEILINEIKNIINN